MFSERPFPSIGSRRAWDQRSTEVRVEVAGGVVGGSLVALGAMDKKAEAVVAGLAVIGLMIRNEVASRRKWGPYLK